MVRLVRSASHFLLVLLTLGISCTIVEDSDIQNLDAFSKLKLKSFEINQINQNGQSKVTKVGTTFNSDGQLQQISWPLFNGDKFGFRSSTITGPVTSSITYNSSGKVIVFDIKSANTSLEKYTFEYNADGNLSKLISEGTFPNNVIGTTDIIEYALGKPSKINRTTTTTAGPITPVNYNISYNSSDGSVFSFGTNTLDPNHNEYIQTGGGDCPDGGNHKECSPYGSGTGLMLTFWNEFNGTKQTALAFGESYNQGEKAPDKYAFHPLMILRTEINHSDALMIFYMIDWWTIRVQNSTGGNVKRDLVVFNFSFGI